MDRMGWTDAGVTGSVPLGRMGRFLFGNQRDEDHVAPGFWKLGSLFVDLGGWF